MEPFGNAWLGGTLVMSRPELTPRVDRDYVSVTYGVYGKKIYFLNTDTRHPRTFTWRMAGESHELTLKPCEIHTVAR